jgi:phenylpropionate dioxygenase-like ring-hydroxylating dioxygenase large terminal subunit
MGEDLFAFGDKSGAAGLLELHCPHRGTSLEFGLGLLELHCPPRGTSLEFGLIGGKGISCCCHGWLVDVDGTILETPGEPACRGGLRVEPFASEACANEPRVAA